ncbi:MAG: hypothetical protein HQ481_16015 [Alphaproteobacteria bacterium]|nr:hypothetical protein [Alphaproteobacteria bacterium]
MRQGTALTHLFSLVILFVFGVSGVYAFSGSPFLSLKRTSDFVRPEWSREITGPHGYPVYRLRADGSALAVGRVILHGGERIEVSLFPDLDSVALADSDVILMETNAQALWALVPPSSKAEVAVVLERVARSMRDRFVTIVRDPAFDTNYRERLQEIIEDAYTRLRRNPVLNIAGQSMTEIFGSEYSERLADALLPVVLPRMRQAAFEMLTPSWQGVSGFVTEGKIDFEPIGRAAVDILADETVQRVAVNNMFDVARDDRVWRLGVLLADAYVDALSSDPRLEKLVEDLFRDPAFRAEMQMLERESAAAMTAVFSRLIGRGANAKPDILAVRIIRYILLNRPRMVAVIVPKEPTLSRELLYRYTPLVRYAR